MVVVVFLTAVLDAVVVAPAEVVVVVSLPTFSIKFALSMDTANFCHFRSDMSFQPHESVTFFDSTTLQPIPYSTGSIRASNTWINPNSKVVVPASNQPSALITNSSSHGNGPTSST